MSYAAMDYKEIRIIIEPELTQVYVLIQAIGDCPIGVQGWHHKTFPASKNVTEIIGSLGVDDPVTWPLNAPPIPACPKGGEASADPGPLADASPGETADNPQLREGMSFDEWWDARKFEFGYDSIKAAHQAAREAWTADKLIPMDVRETVAAHLRELAKRENPGKGKWGTIGSVSKTHWLIETDKIITMLSSVPACPKGGEAGSNG